MKQKVGILAFQGDIEEHEQALESLGVKSIRVKTIEDLKGLTHLIFPGGESTTIGKFLDFTGVGRVIQKRVKEKSLQIYGSCAGAILLSKNVETKIPVNNLELIDINISRNAYGSQVYSFQENLVFKPNKHEFEAVFIRAPKILSIGADVKILVERNGEVFMAEQGNVLVSTFHPELISPAMVHEYFLGK